MKGSRKVVVMFCAFIFFLISLIFFAVFWERLSNIATPFYTSVGICLAAFFAANLGEHWLNGKK